MLIGVDAGGTSTRAIVVDTSGRCRGFGVAGGGNPISWGPVQASRAIRDAVTQAVRYARESEGSADDSGDLEGRGGGAAIIAMAGASALISPGAMTSDLRELGHSSRVDIVSDLLATFCSGTARQSGYVLVSGTGAAGLRIHDGQIVASADGLGWLLGDSGSGFWIGRKVVRAALADLDGYGPRTAMTSLVRRELGLPEGAQRNPRGRFMSLNSAVDVLYQLKPVELSRFATIAFTAAADGDPVAAGILDRAREHLVRTISTVWDAEDPGPIVLGGSIAARLPGLESAIRVAMEVLAEQPVVMVPDGAVGAAVLALRTAHVTVDDEVFARLVTSTAAFR